MVSLGKADWSKARRFKEAVRKVLDEEWTQVKAAEWASVSRSQLSEHVKAERRRRREVLVAAEVEHVAAVEAFGSSAVDSNMPPFAVWWETYFGAWQCPDCEVHHSMPAFHDEIIGELEEGHRRVLVNLPPYHSKSTLVSVWWVLYNICRDRNIRFCIISKSEGLAKAFLSQIRKLMVDETVYGDGPNLIDDFGPFFPESGVSRTGSSTEFTVTGRTRAEKDPTVLALGWGSQIYGRRFDKIVMDDIATLDNQRNPDRVLSMLEDIDKEVLSRIGKSGQAVWVGTRVAAGDIYSTLMGRPGYRVVRYSLVEDDETERVLWPEHFPYSQAMIHRSEMKAADFQLIYQNVDVPGLGASFTQEMVDETKDLQRSLGHFDPKWRLIAGLDPAGASKHSGFTAFTLLGVDLNTGVRYLVDQYAERQMKAPAMKDLIMLWSEQYPLFEWRVEVNGLQSQLFQYNVELVQALAQRGIRMTPHTTSKNKWDPQFGVESSAPIMSAGLFNLPWSNVPTRQKLQPFVEELVAFPMSAIQDRVMSWWFAELGVRDLLNRAHLPMFNDRMRVPKRVQRRRRVVDFNARDVRKVGMRHQRAGHRSATSLGYDRLTVGRPMRHGHLVEDMGPEEQAEIVNIDPSIWTPRPE